MFPYSYLYLVQTILISIPTIVGWYRYKELEKGHQYFFYYLLLSTGFFLSNLIIDELMVKTKILYGWYAASGFLLFHILYFWESSLKMKQVFRIFALLSPFFILTEFIIRIKELIKIPSYVFIMMSVIFSLLILPQLLDQFTNNKKAWTNSKVLILVPLVLSFLLNALLHIIYVVIFSTSTQLILGQSSFVLRVLFLFSYFSFTIAMLWAPRKEVYI